MGRWRQRRARVGAGHFQRPIARFPRFPPPTGTGFQQRTCACLPCRPAGTLRALLAAGAASEAASGEGQTPLHLAAKAGHVAAVHALLEAGAGVTPTDAHGCMPLHYCALRGDLALFVLLFSPSAPALAPAGGAGAALLIAAIRGGSSEMVGIVLMTGAATPQVGERGGCGRGSGGRCWPLRPVAPGCSRFAGCSGLAAGLAGGRSTAPMVRLAAPCSLLLPAACCPDPPTISPSPSLPLSPTPQKCREAGQMPVHAAAREGSLDVLQYLYGSGFDMAQLDEERKSPLHHTPIGSGGAAASARRGADHRQVAEALLAGGCRVDAQDAHGCTPLHFAAGAGALGMLCRFIELSPAGAAGVDLPDSIGWTPLFWACNNGHGEGRLRAAQRSAAQLSTAHAEGCVCVGVWWAACRPAPPDPLP